MFVRAAVLIFACCSQFMTALNNTATFKYTFDLSFPQRRQWEENMGYCGEVSTISSGLLYGQYFSQYDARIIAAKYQTLKAQARTEYLLGDGSDTYCASAMKMNAEAWNSKTHDTQSFLAVKTMVRKGYPVTIGVYMNQYLFYGSQSSSAGDSDYDHIVSVAGIMSNYNDDLYHSDDLLMIEDHGESACIADLSKNCIGVPQYIFNYTFAAFPGSRTDANAKTGNRVYTLPLASKALSNYAISHTGIMDTKGDCLPISLSVSHNYESPDIVDGSETRPKAMDITLTVTVSGLKSGTAYILYKYNDEAAVPTAAFNSNAKKATSVTSFTATAATYVLKDAIKSSDKAIYRAVKSTAA